MSVILVYHEAPDGGDAVLSSWETAVLVASFVQENSGEDEVLFRRSNQLHVRFQLFLYGQ
jgi:hypothetical protein